MLDFFKTIQEMEAKNRNLAVTFLEGRFFGEKALISNGTVIWQSQKYIPWFDYLYKLEEVRGSGVCAVNETKLYCEVLGKDKKIVICGGGHVSIPIIQISRMIGFQVLVLEDRPKFADDARRAGASQVICEPFTEGLTDVKGDQDTFFVIVTRGHRYDQVCLESIVEKEHAYIGMIGSKRRAAKVKEAILAKGKKKDVVCQVHTPIGLNIGAQTPEEIAVAVMAEIIQEKNKGECHLGYPKEIMNGILNNQTFSLEKVLATIVMRKGSAPRGAGTKMLVMADGTCIGTIGGGCLESEIVQKALSMIRADRKKCELCHVDLTGEDAEEDGMVCGGVLEVLLERI